MTRIQIQYLHLLVWVCLCVFSCGQSAPPSPDAHAARKTHEEAHKEKTVVCPVCGLAFSPEDAEGSIEVNGKRYFFYLKDHLKAFEAAPASFLETH